MAARDTRKVAKKAGSQGRARSGLPARLLGLGAMIAGLVVVVAVVASGGLSPQPALPPGPVVIEEWSDFQWGACKAFALGQGPELIQSYIDVGKVTYTKRPFAILGPESGFAAEAAMCAGDQGKEAPFARLLYTRQGQEGKNTYSKANLKAYAAELGLDTTAFNACVDTSKYTSKVASEKQSGEMRGVDATPTLIIDGELVKGVPPMDQLKAKIDAAIRKRGR